LLDDMKLLSGPEFLERLESILGTQEAFYRNPRAFGCEPIPQFLGDRFFHEMKKVRSTVRRVIAQGRPWKRLVRSRVGRAAERAGLPPHLFADCRAAYRSYVERVGHRLTLERKAEPHANRRFERAG